MELPPGANHWFHYSSPIGILRGEISKKGLVSLTLIRDGDSVNTDSDTGDDSEVPYLAEIRSQLDSYFRGDLDVFSVDLDMSDLTSFQRKVYDKLRLIPFGSLITYGELGRMAGVEEGARAVGGAMGRNPYLLIVPCHRVISAGGRGKFKLGGFSAGIKIKRRLLSFEGSLEGIESD
jgi:methylated-DNA-[protein]-cysteine S-methyltransferase